MANGEFLEVLSPSALKDLQALNAEIVKTIAGVKQANANMINIKTPSGSDGAMKSLTAQYDAQAKTIQVLQQRLNTLSIAQRSNTTTTGRQTAATRESAVATQILRAETDRNIRANTLMAGAYAKASAQLLILKKEAKDAAIAFGEQSVQAQRASKAALDLDGRIKSADKSAGDFQRNVGNYSNGVTKGIGAAFSGLRQLAYILPGLGIAGIFNLAIEAITPLIQSLEVFRTKIDAVKESKKALEEINKEGVVNATNELISLKGNLQIAQDVNLSYKERMIAVDNLQKSYPFYFANLTKEQILAGETQKAEDALTKAILSRAKANAAVGKITENQGKIIDLEQAKIDLSKELTAAKLNEARAILYAKQAMGQRGESAAVGASTAIQKRAGIQKDIALSQKDINALEEINNRLTDYALANQEKAIGLDYKEDKSKKGKLSNSKEKLALTFSAIKSEYELQKAIIQRQMVEAGDRMNNEKSSLDDRLKARQEFSEKSIQLLDLEIKEENALLFEKYNNDLAKNNLAYKNKELTFKQYSENIQIINERTNNEQQTANLKNSIKFNELLNQDLAFCKKIEDEKQKFSQATAKMIVDLEIKKLQRIVDNANGEKYTLIIREQAFEQIQRLKIAELDLAKIRELANAKSQEETANIIQKYKDLEDNLANLRSPIKEAQQATEDWISKFSNGQLERSLNSIGLSSAKMFLDFDINGQSSFDKLMEGADTVAEKFAVTFQAVGDLAQEAFNLMSEASNASFQNEYANLAQQRDIAIMFAGESSTAREEIERQYEQRQRQIKKREFQTKKQQALFNIAIDTAQGIVSALASTPPNVPLSIAIGVIGALQATMVASQQAPQFWKGTDNAPEGMAWTQERGQEIITDKHGKIKDMGDNKGARLTKLSKGDKVLNNDKTMDYLMFNNDLNNILTGNQIGSPIIDVNSPNIDFSPVVNAINNKESASINIDRDGLEFYVTNGHQRKQEMNNRINFTGKRV